MIHLDLTGEFTALVFALILLAYARASDAVPTFRNRVFRACLYVVSGSIALTLADLLLAQTPVFPTLPVPLQHLLEILFFVSTPLNIVMFSIYVAAFVLDEGPRLRRVAVLIGLPFLFYAATVATSPWTGFIYSLDPVKGMVDGPGTLLIFATIYVYILGMTVVVLAFRKRIEAPFRNVLLSFPVAAVAIVVVQELFLAVGRQVVLIGTASMSALLIVYLFLQNKRIVVDELTGFKNRRAFLGAVDYELRRRRRFSVVLVSLDDFRAVNHQFGQANGDRVLREMARWLATAAPLKNLYRFAGDEFAVLAEDVPEGALPACVAAIRARFEAPWCAGDIACRLSASLAVLRVPGHAANVEDLVSLLEHCVARSKRSGKGQLVRPDDEMLAVVRRRSRVQEALRAAIEQDRIDVHFQPILTNRDGRYRTAEALARLHDPEIGDIPPKEFIPIAEESGLIVPLGDRVLEGVCRFIQDLERRRAPFDSVSINCSSIQLFQEGMAERTLAILGARGISPRRIHVEVTESVFIDRVAAVKSIMATLQAAGVQFDLDDFGTGYSNLSTVVELPFRNVKFDRSLLYEAQRSRRTYTMLKATAQAFEDCGMGVVVEGVETPEQRVLADRIAAQYCQGYLYARPMPAAQAAEYLSR